MAEVLLSAIVREMIGDENIGGQGSLQHGMAAMWTRRTASWSSIPYHPDQKISLDIIGRDMKMPREMPDSLIHGPIPSI